MYFSSSKRRSHHSLSLLSGGKVDRDPLGVSGRLDHSWFTLDG
jgi:hypothetical protein